jgi:hypothetical protein
MALVDHGASWLQLTFGGIISEYFSGYKEHLRLGEPIEIDIGTALYYYHVDTVQV